MFFPRLTKQQPRKRPVRRRERFPTEIRKPGVRRIQIEMEDDTIDSFNGSRPGLGRILNRLGPSGKYFLVSIIIAMMITITTIYYDQKKVSLVVGEAHYTAGQIILGQSLYSANCAFCHGDNLEGKLGWDKTYRKGRRPPTPLKEGGRIAQMTDRDVFDIIKYGGQPFSSDDYKNNMPGFEMQLDDKSIWAILAYIKSRR